MYALINTDDYLIVNADTDVERAVFEQVLSGREYANMKEIRQALQEAEDLIREIGDVSDLNDREYVLHVLDPNNWTVNYWVRTGQNGYSRDTHQYKTALRITEREEEEEEED